MSLTESLALLALATLLALAAHGWWRTRRIAKARQAAAAAVATRESGFSGSRIEPTLGAGTQGSDTITLRLPPQRRLPRLDALIDAIATIPLDAPVLAESLLPHLPPSRRAGAKPLLVEGLDAESGQWEPVTQLPAGRRVAELQAGVQLANRSGALNEIEYSEFLQKVQALAEALNSSADAPDMLDAVARARELEALTAPLDAQLTVTLRSNGVAWSMGYLQQVAAGAGLVAGALPGRWVRPAPEDGAPPLMVLAVDAQAAMAAMAPPPGRAEAGAEGAGGPAQVQAQAEAQAASAVRQCTLSLDVPQNAATAEAKADGSSTALDSEPFPLWHRTAVHLAEALDATIVDDHGQPITPAAFAGIGDEVSGLYQRLEALDLAAGSAAARRLFS